MTPQAVRWRPTAPARRFGARRWFGPARPPHARRRPWIFTRWAYPYWPEPAIVAPYPAAAAPPEPAPDAPASDAASPEPAAPEPDEPAPAEPGPEQPAGEPAADEELARRAKLAAQLEWTQKLIDRFPIGRMSGKGGVYIVEASGKPLYVGETHNFASRWHGRLASMYQMGLIGKGALPRPLTVWLGALAPNTQKARKTVEHAIIRTLTRGRLFAEASGLRNQSSVLEFTATGPISIRGLLPPPLAARIQNAPFYSRNVLLIPSGEKYELEARAFAPPRGTWAGLSL
jgi:hypothetical protein